MLSNVWYIFLEEGANTMTRGRFQYRLVKTKPGWKQPGFLLQNTETEPHEFSEKI